MKALIGLPEVVVVPGDAVVVGDNVVVLCGDVVVLGGKVVVVEGDVVVVDESVVVVPGCEVVLPGCVVVEPGAAVVVEPCAALTSAWPETTSSSACVAMAITNAGDSVPSAATAVSVMLPSCVGTFAEPLVAWPLPTASMFTLAAFSELQVSVSVALTGTCSDCGLCSTPGSGSTAIEPVTVGPPLEVVLPPGALVVPPSGDAVVPPVGDAVVLAPGAAVVPPAGVELPGSAVVAALGVDAGAAVVVVVVWSLTTGLYDAAFEFLRPRCFECHSSDEGLVALFRMGKLSYFSRLTNARAMGAFMSADASSNQSSAPGGTTQVNALQCRVGKPFRLTWTAKAGSPITISSDQALNADGKLNKQLNASGDDEHLDITPTTAGDFTITITAYDKAGGDIVQTIEDDVTVFADPTQLLPPWKTGDAVTGPSSFHLVTQCLAGKNVHGSHDTNNPVISKNGSDASGNFSWTDNGCGPASVAGTMRWYSEQGIITDDDLKSVVNGSSANNADAYMLLLFPKLKGQVPTTASSDCDLDAVYTAAQKKYGIKHTVVSLPTPAALAALLKVAPVICTWNKPAHFSTVHGVVLDSAFKANVWIADPGSCLAAGTKKSYWAAESTQNVGTPSGGASPVGSKEYISVPWAFFASRLFAACQLLKS